MSEFREYLKEAKAYVPYGAGTNSDAGHIATPFKKCIDEFEEQLTLMKQQLNNLEDGEEWAGQLDEYKKGELKKLTDEGTKLVSDLKKAFTPVGKWMKKGRM